MAWMNFSDGPFAEALVWTILHSIWQFVVIALGMSFLLKMYQNHKSSVRYYISLTSMFVALLTFVLTFMYFYYEGNGDVTLFPERKIHEVRAIIAQTSVWDQLYAWIQLYQKPIFLTWALGATLFGLRLTGSMVYVAYLVRSMSPIYHQNVYQTFTQMALHFGIKDSIRIGESKHISSPMILGLIKPVILFPIGMINQLETEEVDSILAHELAHFVRKDIYINVIQTTIEAILYYHPAIWWISANIRVERENCCDEMAISYLGDNIKYAKTLVKMQEIKVNGPSLALNFNNKNSFFSNRIKRILNMAQTRNLLKEKIITTVVLAFLVLFSTKNLTGSQAALQTSMTQQTNQKQIIMQVHTDSLPTGRESIRIQKRTNDQDIKISIEDGKVTELEIDGKKIDEADYDKYEDIIAQSKPKSSSQGNARMFFFGDGEPQSFEFDLGNDGKLFSDSIFKRFDFKGMDGFDMSNFNEQMKKLQEQLGNMQFDFRSLDSMNFKGLDGFNFDFAFPEMEHFKGRFDFEDGDIFIEPFGSDPENMPDFNTSRGNNNFSDAIGNALNRDGLLIPNQSNKVELTGKHLKINGEKQPNNIYQKYRRIFEEESGTTLEKNSKLQFTFEGKEAKRKYKVY
jgi:beta-lactamase regulating signal transducer with metallopeptidase domain